MRVVAVAAAVVEAQEREARRELPRLERAAGVVADHERDSGSAQRVIRVADEPRGVAELERVPAARQVRECMLEPLVAAREIRWELPENFCALALRRSPRRPGEVWLKSEWVISGRSATPELEGGIDDVDAPLRPVPRVRADE